VLLIKGIGGMYIIRLHFWEEKYDMTGFALHYVQWHMTGAHKGLSIALYA